MTVHSAHRDTFVRDHLPPVADRPQMTLSAGPNLVYPDRLNAAAELLDTWIARGAGDRVVFHHAAGSWTYQRLLDTANRIAHVLVSDCGLVPGGRVLLRSANHPMLAACWFAVLKAGGVAVTTMPLLRPRELTEILDKAHVDLAITEASVASDLDAAMSGRQGSQMLVFGGSSETGSVALERRMAAKPSAFSHVDTAAEDPAIIAFTSGTTGRSKGTVHTHRDLLAAADTYGHHVLCAREDDIFIGSPPLGFTFGLGGLVLFPMRIGASTALIEQPSPPALLEAIARFRATVTFTSPTAYRAMLKHITGADVRSLRLCVSAGETLPAATFDAWLRETGIRLMDGIGSTEMLHMFIGCRAADAKPGATGTIVPGYIARVVDEAGVEVPRGTIGRLAVIGPTGCRYLDDPINQHKYVQDGWNLTGDAYRQDADGYFWYESRTDDMIVSSGYNVSGAEVENVLLGHAAVSECAVVGVSDEARGQIVKAFVVTTPGTAATDTLAKDLQNYVKAELAPYKYPRAIEFVDALPRTATGKIQRFRLRKPDVPSETPTHAAGGNGAVSFHEPQGWPRPRGYANAASAKGRVVFAAGQIGWDPITGALPAGDFVAEVRQALANVVAALGAAGAKPNQITRLTWFITDRDEYLRLRNEIGLSYREIIGRHFPPMSVVVVSALIESGARVEIEATAVVEE